MIQVYKHNHCYIVYDTITDTCYPNLNRKEAAMILHSYGRTSEDRLKYPMDYKDYIETYIYSKEIKQSLLNLINIKKESK